MRFLSGLLKTLSIILMIAATMICTAVCVSANLLEAFIVMGAVWIGCILVALNIWGTGLALSSIHKLRKKVDSLEQRLLYYPAQQRTVPQTGKPEEQFTQPIPAVNAPENIPNNGPAAVTTLQPNNSGIKKWLPAIIGGGVALVAIIVLVIVIAVGGNDKPETFPEETSPFESETQAEDTDTIEPEMPAEIAPDEVFARFEAGEITPDNATAEEMEILIAAGLIGPENETEEAPAEYAGIGMGETFGTGFVDFTFNDFVVEKDIKHEVKTGIVTRITGPDPVDGQQYLCLTGMVYNTSKSPLPVYDFFNGRYVIDGYTYDLNSTNYDVLDAEGQTVSEIDPLMEYKLRIYVAIPDKLAESFSKCQFSFGFYDEFDNKDLSYNRSFGEDPIDPCPYKFTMLLP